MIFHRPASERGHFDHGWLKSWHTFSFSEYRDPNFMGFRNLRVINEDIIAPNMGFPEHPHRDMEIISYVIDGRLQHKDSLGNVGEIQNGEIQYMRAGSGIIHAEMNPDSKIPTHLLQIWIMPKVKGLPPAWDQFRWADRKTTSAGLRLLASPDGGDGSTKINQDAWLWHGSATTGQTITIPLDRKRYGWLQIIKGQVTIPDSDAGKSVVLGPSDGAALAEMDSIQIDSTTEAEFLLFDML